MAEAGLCATDEQLAEWRKDWTSSGIPAFHMWRDPMGSAGVGPPCSHAVCLHCGAWMLSVVLADLHREMGRHGIRCTISEQEDTP